MARAARLQSGLLLLTCFAIAGTAMAADGAATFQEWCAACHGAKGEGNPALAPALKANPFVKTATPDDIKALVKNGRVGNAKKYPQIPTGMPPQPVYDDDLDAVVKYVREDLQK